MNAQTLTSFGVAAYGIPGLVAADAMTGASPTAQGCGSSVSCGTGTSGQGSAPQPAAPAVTQQMVQSYAVSASSSMQLPASVPSIGPDPASNEWHMLAVGLPVWAWTHDPTTQSQDTTTNGITITFQGTRTSTTIDWGDGTSSTCTSMTPRPADADPMAQSPDCGHVYQRKGTFTITATSAWSVTWSALGYSGSLGLPRSASTSVDVGELHAVVVGRH